MTDKLQSELHEVEESEEVKKKKQTIRKKIARCSTRSEITSWRRKEKNINKLMEEEITPIQDKILALRIEMMEHVDKLETIRAEMVKTCIHPVDHVEVHLDKGHSTCKFCDRNIKLLDE